MEIHNRKRRTWKAEEDEFLRATYHKVHYHKIGEQLGRNLGSISKRAKTLGLTNRRDTNVSNFEKYGYDKETLTSAVGQATNIKEVVRLLNKTSSGPTYKIIQRALFNYGIDTSHFNPWKNNRVRGVRERPIEHYLVYGSTIGSSGLKERLYKEGIKQRQCEKCGQGEEWNGEKMSLILDHINGDPKDNQLVNLRIVCPNCNATLPTHCRGKKVFIKKEVREIDVQRENNGGRTDKQIRLSLSQRKAERPPIEILERETEELGFVATGRKYGVSDNAIRKWLKQA
mgnify:FL=1